MEHIWNGTVLTVISDSGASSADLQGPRGATGPRGPQGPAGVILNEQGQIAVDLSPYYTGAEVDEKIAAAVVNVDLENYPTEAEMAAYVSSALGPYATKNDLGEVNVDLTGYATETYVNNKISNHSHSNYASKAYVDNSIANLDVDVDLTDYATKNYVSTEIAKAQMEGAEIDTSGFATKDDLANYIPVDGVTIKIENGKLVAMTDSSSDNIPYFNLADYGVPTITPNGVKVDITTDTTNIYAAMNNSLVKFGLSLNYLDIPVDTEIIGIPMYLEETNTYQVTRFLTMYETPIYGSITIGNGFIRVLADVIDSQTMAASNITYGTTDLTAGSSYLPSGTLYVVYE